METTALQVYSSSSYYGLCDGIRRTIGFRRREMECLGNTEGEGTYQEPSEENKNLSTTK